jgi:hypothetical protein
VKKRPHSPCFCVTPSGIHPGTASLAPVRYLCNPVLRCLPFLPVVMGLFRICTINSLARLRWASVASEPELTSLIWVTTC